MKDNTIKGLLIIFMLLILFILMVYPSVSAYSVNPGECVDVTINNITETVCANEPENKTLLLSLNSGESLFNNVDYCYYNISCEGCEQSSVGVCDITKNLKAGEQYIKESGACNIDFECKESSGCDWNESLENYTIPLDFEFIKTDNTLTLITGNDQLLRIEGVPTNYNFPFTYQFVCPSFGRLDDYNNVNVTAALCKDYVSNVDGQLLLEAYSKMLDTTEFTKVLAKDDRNDYTECLTNLASKNSLLSTTTVNYEVCIKKVINKSIIIDKLNNELLECDNSVSNRGGILMIFIILFFVSFFLNIILLILKYKDKISGGKL